MHCYAALQFNAIDSFVNYRLIGSPATALENCRSQSCSTFGTIRLIAVALYFNELCSRSRTIIIAHALLCMDVIIDSANSSLPY